jgi:hypothetical protein
MRAIVLAALLVLPGAASADCLAIRDYDRRQACLAEQRQSPEGCQSIWNWDDREACRQRAGQRDMFGRRQDGFDIRR